jgi:serine/threonine/tyrosine protein kinase RAD53
MVEKHIEMNRDCADIANVAVGSLVFHYMGSLGILMRLYEGGDLYDWISRSGHISEEESARLIRHLLTGLAQMHKMGIAHLDVRPEHILLDFCHGQPIAFLGGLGSARHFGSGPAMFTEPVGVIPYMAPELRFFHAGDSFTESVDLWSLGVTLYAMLAGKLPFQSDSDVREVHYDKEKLKELGISEAGRDFLDKLLKVNPDERLTAEQALQHPWMQLESRE